MRHEEESLGRKRAWQRVSDGDLGRPWCEGEELELSSEPSAEAGALGRQSLRGPPSQVFGLGAVAHMVLGEKLGSYLGVNLGFGFGVTMGVHVAGKISGE